MTGIMKHFLLGLLLLGICHAIPTKGKGDEPKDPRLPRHLIPIRYDLKLKPFFDGSRKIEGEVTILMECVERASNITVHVNNIKVQETKVKDEDGKDVAVKNTEEVKDVYFFVAHLEKEMEEGKNYTVYFKFNSHLNDELAGLYKSTYKHDDGSEASLVTTHFEPIDARRAFPCFDEPDFKAVFKTSLARMKNMSSFENMPLIDTVEDKSDNNWVWDNYEDSRRMSTYLLSYVISDFATREYGDGDKWSLFIHARREAVEDGETEYVGDIAPRILSYYEEFFGIDFPLPKMGLVAMPDFPSGASEMWGLIIFRETRLLFNPKLSSLADKQSTLLTVAHELAHQWFGNLVTMEWWDDLWLNEGFASYVEYVGADHVEPTARFLEQIVVEELQKVMELDSLDTSHPISVPVTNPEEINALFDDISYGKGCSIVRMMRHFITPDTFKSGLQNYLSVHAFGNANKDDLWEALTDAAHEDGTLPDDLTVKDIMDTWTVQMGFPVVTVERMDDGKSVQVSQHRFHQSKNASSSADYSWWVPLSYTNSKESDFSVENTKAMQWIPKEKDTMTVKDVADSVNDWVIFNIQETGYYRVNYDEHNWYLLIIELKSGNNKIPGIQRAQLINDAFHLAAAGQLDFAIVMALMQYLPQEKDHFPLTAAFSTLGKLDLLFQQRGGYGSLKHFVRKIVDPLYENIDFESFKNGSASDFLERATDIMVIRKACQYENEDCIDRMTQMFNEFKENYDEEHPDDPENQVILDIKDTIYCQAIKHGGEDDWSFLWKHYLLSTSATEKDLVLSALSCSRDVWILSGYLETVLDPSSGVRTQDGRTVFISVAANPVGRFLAWDFIRNNWDEILSLYGSGLTVIGRFLPAVTEGFTTEQKLDELIEFDEKTKGNQGSAERSFQQSIEAVRANVEFMEQYYDYVVSMLNNITKNSD